MEEKEKTLLRNNLTNEVRSLSVCKEDLYRLLNTLKERTDAAKKIELDNFQKFDQEVEVYEKNKETIAESFQLRVTVTSGDGQELFGTVEDIFNSPNFPEDVKAIFIASDSVLTGAYNYQPRNYVHVFLDFSKPKLFDLSILPSVATPNGSRIVVSGYDPTWVHGVFNELSNFVKAHLSKMTWIHKHSIYDLLVWGFGLPFGFWITYRSSEFLTKLFGSFSTFVQSAAYVYVFLASLIVFRLLFHYARWVWPLVEYRGLGNAALKHRVAVSAISLSLLTTAVYDLFKAMF